MNEREKAFHKPDRNRRGQHGQPTRLEQIEDALHRLTKKVGKLNKERKAMRDAYEQELADLKTQNATLAEELEQVKAAQAKKHEKLNKWFKMLAAGEDEENEGEHDPMAMALNKLNAHIGEQDKVSEWLERIAAGEDEENEGEHDPQAVLQKVYVALYRLAGEDEENEGEHDPQ